ncbi:peptidylprolyl isomerase [Pannonibacter tanglangensis]|uniref:Parvulin-like PPIase n=1 Tax=Pannonibacter tanglangensis TaxID=2750084 RepID=A0ABW9ZHE1_9HYPH|nr:SurA N-terminal domain-containing protein [Pannonibacter sp. XCT-34]NBN64113.1 peptidylprolyl isomerase [Pannonibacter sp. XCT-34]
MLDALRKGAGTWVAKIFLVLLVFSFAIWGIADVFRGFSSSTAAKVGNAEVSLTDFDRAYRLELDQIGRQIGRPLSTTEGAQFGIPQQVLSRLIADAAMNDEANRLNIGLSDTELARMIQSTPQFQRGGTYDRNRLLETLRQNGIREEQFVEDQRAVARRMQIAEGATGAMAAPRTMLEAINAYENETRAARYILIAPTAVGEIAAPDEAALTTFYEERKAEFRAPETRALTLLELSPERLANAGEVSDEEARAEYDRTIDRYRNDERRRVRQIPFTDSAEAEAAAAELAAGKTFAELMAARNLKDSDVDLGLLTRDKFLDPAVAEAAFALPQGATSQPVKGRFSTLILEVAEIQPASTQPFEAVRDEIKADLATRRAEQEVSDLHDEIEDARASGALLGEVASRFGLQPVTIPAVDAAGRDAAGAPVTLPPARDLLAKAFESDVGVENDALALGTRGFLWFDVTAVTPARDRDLSEVRPAVVEAWLQAERTRKLGELALATAERLRKGETLEAVAAEKGLEVRQAPALKRNLATEDLPAETSSQAFAGPVGTVVEAAGAGGTRAVLVVDSIATPAFFVEAEEIKPIDEMITRQLQSSLLSQLINEVEAQKGVEINQAGIAQIIGTNTQN